MCEKCDEVLEDGETRGGKITRLQLEKGALMIMAAMSLDDRPMADQQVEELNDLGVPAGVAISVVLPVLVDLARASGGSPQAFKLAVGIQGKKRVAELMELYREAKA